MTRKAIWTLAILTVIASGAAIFVAVQQPSTNPVQVMDEPAFPALRAALDQAAKVAIETPDGSMTLNRAKPGRWLAPDRYEYPVAADKIRELIVQLADMRLIEPKTTRADRYPRLEVEDLATDDAKSRLVRVEGADGQTLAAALIGKRRNRLTGTEPLGTYLRLVDDEQSWLASGGIELDATVQNWLEATIVDLLADDVQRVEVIAPNGDAYVVLRDDREGELRIEDLGEDEALQDDANLNQLAGAFTALRLADVKPEAEIAWPNEHHTVRVAVFDGLELTVQLATIDDQRWLLVEAGTGDLADMEAEAAEAAKEQATAITERTDGWAYQVDDLVFERLIKARAEWLKKPDKTS